MCVRPSTRGAPAAGRVRVAKPRIRNRRSCWSGGHWPLMTGPGPRSWRESAGEAGRCIAPAPVTWRRQARTSAGWSRGTRPPWTGPPRPTPSLLGPGLGYRRRRDGLRPAGGNRGAAVDRLQEAYALYQKLEVTDCMDRVRARLRATGVRGGHWSYADRPAFGWASLTDTERRIVYLAAQRAQQSPDSEPHVPQRAHDRVSPAPGVLQARRLLPGAAGQPRSRSRMARRW